MFSRVRVSPGAARRLVIGVELAAAAIMCTGCDPCFGVASCGATYAKIVIDGQIVRAEDGRGVDFARIDVLRTGGVALHEDSVSTETRDDGHWRVEIPALTAGEVVFDVRVTPPLPQHAYVARGVHASTVTRASEATILDRWVADPYIPFVAELFLRNSGETIHETWVEFRRTGGPPLLGPAVEDSAVQVATDRFGRTPLFMYRAFPADTGDVIGDIIVHLDGPYGLSRINGVRLSPSHIYRAPVRVARFGVGPTLDYVAVLFDRATGRPASNVQMTFRRIAGVPLTADTFTVTSGDDGRVAFRTRPLATGGVLADITLRHPRGNPETFRDTIQTFDADGGRIHAIWSVGPYLPYFGVVYARGQSVSGMAVRVRRTGGIDVAPADTVVRTNAAGVVSFGPIPLAAGDAIFELTFTPPAPFSAFAIRNLRLSTLQHTDPQGRLVWVWNLENGPSGPPGTEIVPLP